MHDNLERNTFKVIFLLILYITYAFGSNETCSNFTVYAFRSIEMVCHSNLNDVFKVENMLFFLSVSHDLYVNEKSMY